MKTSTTLLTLTIITLSFSISTAVESCKQGEAYDQTTQKCQPCPPATYAQDGVCKPCPEGTYAISSGSTSCKKCQGGEYAVNGRYCDKCPRGSFAKDGEGVCTKCPLGLVSTDLGSPWCYPCDSGTYAVDGVYCEECPEGLITKPRSTSQDDCILCPTGTFWKRRYGATFCQECGSGEFDVDRKSCVTTCPMGTVTLKSQRTCEQCPPGTISGQGASECVKCRAGGYERDRSICLPCPEGYYCLEGTSGRNGSIKCPPGSISHGGASKCEPCGPGSYATEGDARDFQHPQCNQCEPGTFGVDGIRCNLCPNGTIAAKGASVCTPCAEGMLSWNNNTQCLTSKQIQDLQTPSPARPNYLPYLLIVAILVIAVSVVVYKRHKKQVHHQDFEKEEEANLVGNQGSNYQRHQ